MIENAEDLGSRQVKLKHFVDKIYNLPAPRIVFKQIFPLPDFSRGSILLLVAGLKSGPVELCLAFAGSIRYLDDTIPEKTERNYL